MIHASFAKPVGLFDNYFNRFVATITWGEYCHSEFIVTWTEAEAIEFLQNKNLDISILKKWKNHMDDDDKLHICFYVLWGDKTTYRLLKQNHTNPFYRMPNDHQFSTIKLNLDQAQEYDMVEFLFKEMKKNYDYTGALTYFVPLRRSHQEYASYFCSQWMICALQKIKYFQAINPSGVTPNKLYNLIKNHPTL